MWLVLVGVNAERGLGMVWLVTFPHEVFWNHLQGQSVDPMHLLIFCVLSVASSLPSSTLLFESGVPPGITYRIPALVQTAKGTLIAFSEARSGGDCSPKYLVSKRSIDNGVTWGPLAVVAGNASSVIGNPTVVFDAKSGKVVVAMASGGCNPATFTGVLDDTGSDGLVWGPPRKIQSMGQYSGALPGPGTAAQLPSGRLLFPAHYGAYVNDIILFSDDHGLTWELSGSVLGKMDEAAIAVVPGASPPQLVLEMRNNHLSPQKTVGWSTSKDLGVTWSPPTFDNPLITPVCQASLVGMGGALYFSGPHSTTSRSNISVSRSEDGGVTWGNTLFQVQEGKGDGYSCMASGNATHGNILYEGSGSLYFASFPLSF
jgi:sialidase-1